MDGMEQVLMMVDECERNRDSRKDGRKRDDYKNQEEWTVHRMRKTIEVSTGRFCDKIEQSVLYIPGIEILYRIRMLMGKFIGRIGQSRLYTHGIATTTAEVEVEEILEGTKENEYSQEMETISNECGDQTEENVRKVDTQVKESEQTVRSIVIHQKKAPKSVGVQTKLRKYDVIQYKGENGEEYTNGMLFSRAVKASGKWRDWWKVKDMVIGDIQARDLSKVLDLRKMDVCQTTRTNMRMCW
jgi:hypothetical protein